MAAPRLEGGRDATASVRLRPRDGTGCRPGAARLFRRRVGREVSEEVGAALVLVVLADRGGGQVQAPERAE
jgi:hypothetical protein